jgi:hypothetical protein
MHCFTARALVKAASQTKQQSFAMENYTEQMLTHPPGCGGEQRRWSLRYSTVAYGWRVGGSMFLSAQHSADAAALGTLKRSGSGKEGKIIRSRHEIDTRRDELRKRNPVPRDRGSEGGHEQ